MDVNTVFYKVGKNIKRIRKAKRITQDRLAAAAHMSISHLGYIERGKKIQPCIPSTAFQWP